MTPPEPTVHHDFHEQPHGRLTDREMEIAKVAAKLAVQEIQDSFYRQVGKSMVTKFLIYLGMGVVGFMVAKGWVTFKVG